MAIEKTGEGLKRVISVPGLALGLGSCLHELKQK